jgi:hypothetical protein
MRFEDLSPAAEIPNHLEEVEPITGICKSKKTKSGSIAASERRPEL